jgi:hypothetical protein
MIYRKKKGKKTNQKQNKTYKTKQNNKKNKNKNKCKPSGVHNIRYVSKSNTNFVSSNKKVNSKGHTRSFSLQYKISSNKTNQLVFCFVFLEFKVRA